MSDAIPVNRIKGVGEKTAALFGKINVYTVDAIIPGIMRLMMLRYPFGRHPPAMSRQSTVRSPLSPT